MKEKRAIINKMANFLAYKVRSGEVSVEGGDKIWKIILANPDKADEITDILDMDLPEADTITKIERLV